MNILLMGATGYLGSHVLASLSKDHEMFVVSRRKADLKADNIHWYSTDEYEQVLKNNRIDWLINCIGVCQKEENWKIIEGNLTFPLQVIEVAVENGVKNFINTNTALPATLNMYSFSKKEFGRFGKFYCEQYDVNFFDLQLELIYGPDEPSERFISSVIDKMKKGMAVELTEGKQKRDIVRVEDICQAVKIVINSSLQGYYDIPVGSGEGHAIRETVEMLHNELQSSSKLLFGAVPMRKNEPNSIADITFLKQLGYVPQYSWEKGLRDMVLCKKTNVK